jgi:hypothetical protein
MVDTVDITDGWHGINGGGGITMRKSGTGGGITDTDFGGIVNDPSTVENDFGKEYD